MRRRVNPPQFPDREAGISLIEMVVAVLVLSIGVIAGFQSLTQSQKGIGGELPRLLAQNVALNRAEELQLLGAAVGASLPKSVVMGGLVWQVDVEQAQTEAMFVEARISVSAPDQPGAVYVVYAPVSAPVELSQ